MTKVHIVCSPSCATTAREVEKLISMGWKLQGNLVVSCSSRTTVFDNKYEETHETQHFSQMMLKEEE